MEVRTFLSAVARVTRLKDWKIMPILRRNLRSALPESLETSVPSTVNSPSVISIMRLMVRISVDLPAPDRPMMATNSPCSNLRLTSLRPLTPLGYVLETCLNSIKRGHFLFAKMRIQTIFGQVWLLNSFRLPSAANLRQLIYLFPPQAAANSLSLEEGGSLYKLADRIKCLYETGDVSLT